MSIITTAIGLILVYLILSLMVSAIQEALASWFSMRSKHFGHAIDQMLTNEKTTEGALELDKSILEKFQSHPSYGDMVQEKNKQSTNHMAHPSYMSAATFSSILLHVLDGSDVKQLTATINAMEDGKLKKFLLDCLAETGNDLTKFRTRLEQWYDQVMSRVSGWYKSYTHKIIMVVGLLVAMYMNADTLSIYQKMSAVAAGSTQEQAIIGLAQDFVDQRYDGFNQQINDIQQSLDSAAQQTDTARYDSLLLLHNERLLAQVDSLVVMVNGANSPLGLGWTKAEWSTVKSNVPVLFNKLIGLLLTTFAISLGAPFWFDMLKKIINIRNAGPVYEGS
ncbi:hypothetical protein [Lewinella sp. LCG006]|uniref:hypothetical protein n=1 Tax=Lewinella sp. LCG006 TaxID=3231911 RepID=UPI00345FAA7D